MDTTLQQLHDWLAPMTWKEHRALAELVGTKPWNIRRIAKSLDRDPRYSTVAKLVAYRESEKV